VGYAYLRKVGADKQRLWIICARPGRDDDELIALSVTGRDSYPNPDLSCPLGIGDHPWITKPSIIFYRSFASDTPGGLQQRIARRNVEPQDPVTDDLVRRIRDGAFLSSFSPPDLKVAIGECAWPARR